MKKISKKELENHNMSKKKNNISKQTTVKSSTKKNNVVRKTNTKNSSNSKSIKKVELQLKPSSKKREIKSKKEVRKDENLNKENFVEYVKPSSNSTFNFKNLLPVFGSIVLSITIIMSISFNYSFIKERLEIRKLSDEIDYITKSISNNEFDDEQLSSVMNHDLTTSNILIIEKNVEDYFSFLVSKNKEMLLIVENENIKNSLDISKIGNQEVLDYYNYSKEKLLVILNEIIENREKYISIDLNDEKLNDLNINFISKIDNSFSFAEIDKTLNYIEETSSAVKYLIDNKSFYDLSSGNLTFLKRSKLEEYQNIISNLSYENISVPILVVDNIPPVINAENISIYKGNSLNINDKIKCVDAVDDIVECKISGSFNSSKVGEYKITITSEDKSENKSSKDIKIIVKEKVSRINTNNMPYYIEVIRNQNIVIVYGLDSNKEYTKVVKVFVASVGRSGKTPVGTFKTTKGLTWGSLIGGVYGQYSTRIVGSILFHSVPYYSKNKGDLEWEEYNKLGTAASAGCVRMTVRDVKWIFDNVASGTTVRIYDGSIPSGITKPSAPKISGDSPNRGWDPTDPDINNPW